MNYMRLLSLFGFCCLLYGCYENCGRPIHYDFNIPVSVSPNKSVLKVGDTLHVFIQTQNDSIYDSYGNEYVAVPDFDPRFTMRMPIIDSFPVGDGFLDNEVIIDEARFDVDFIFYSTLSHGYQFFGIDHNNGFSTIEFKVVLNKPGTYLFNPESAIVEVERSIDWPDRCGKGNLSGIFIFNDNNNKHEDILTHEHRVVLDQYWAERAFSRAESHHYYFRVEE